MYFIGIKCNVRACNNEELAGSFKAQTSVEQVYSIWFLQLKEIAKGEPKHYPAQNTNTLN